MIMSVILFPQIIAALQCGADIISTNMPHFLTSAGLAISFSDPTASADEAIASNAKKLKVESSVESEGTIIALTAILCIYFESFHIYAVHSIESYANSHPFVFACEY